MTEPKGGMNCALGCWALAAGAGVLTFVLLLALGGYKVFAALFLGAVLFVLLGLLLNWLFCTPLPRLGEAKRPGHDSTAGEATAPAKAAKIATGAAVAAGAAGAAAASSSGDAGAAAAAKADADAAAAKAQADADAAAAKAKADADAAAAKAKADADAKAQADAAAKVQADADAAAAKAQADADAAAAKAKADADAAAASASDASSSVKPSAALAGQDDLASRKGEWKYEGDGGGSGAGADAGGAAADNSSTPDYDGDGTHEGTNEGTRPQALDGPRGGKADNLKEIKGIGPKMEKLCNSLGFYHFDQIAKWTPDEVAWVNANLEGFKGRVTRDTWVDQAKILAAGGETEFSKRVEDGDVY